MKTPGSTIAFWFARKFFRFSDYLERRAATAGYWS